MDPQKWLALALLALAPTLPGQHEAESKGREKSKPTSRPGAAKKTHRPSRPTSQPNSSATSRPGRSSNSPLVRIAISVDWEGRDLKAVNLMALRRVRDALPRIPLTHFFSAAYLTRRDIPRAHAIASLRAAIRPGDEVGLHIHPWHSLTQAAGVGYRAAPTVWGGKYREDPSPRRADVGHAVVLESYSVKELRALVRTSKKLLGDAGVSLGSSFRAGAWLAGPRVREAIRAEGFRIDCSATHTRFHDEIRNTALPALIRSTWPNQTEFTQPFTLPTKAGTLVEVPDTGALADYITAAEMIAHVGEAVARSARSRQPLTIHLGFHQETAAAFGLRIRDAVRALQKKHGPHLRFETVRSAASRRLHSAATSKPSK